MLIMGEKKKKTKINQENQHFFNLLKKKFIFMNFCKILKILTQKNKTLTQ